MFEQSSKHYQERIVPFTSGDGMELNLINVRGEKPPTREPVLFVHGAGVRANIFRAPVEETLVDTLIGQGYDVWLVNWRASIDFPPNLWTLDQAAVYDHPKAVQKIVEETGHQKIKAVIHCQGSTSFTMSAMAGLLPEVDTIISNAVSLNTVVPWWSAIKLKFAVPFVGRFTEYLNPAWGDNPTTWVAKILRRLVLIFHHECYNSVCKMVSFTYGAGFPALWRHEEISEETHEWIRGEFKNVPMRFFRQMSKCVSKGNLVSVQDLPELPKNFAAQKPKTDARFIFFAGEKNRCFLPASQERAYQFFNELRPNFHSLHLIPNYSHLDIFMGSNAAKDVFPIMVEELNKEAG